jgi:hypothetical protein
MKSYTNKQAATLYHRYAMHSDRIVKVLKNHMKSCCSDMYILNFKKKHQQQ